MKDEGVDKMEFAVDFYAWCVLIITDLNVENKFNIWLEKTTVLSTTPY